MRGLSNSEIASERRARTEVAQELYITLNTVKTHIVSLMPKLGAPHRVEIASWAHQAGWVRTRAEGNLGFGSESTVRCQIVVLAGELQAGAARPRWPRSAPREGPQCA